MNKNNFKQWAKAAGIRALKTAAQTAVATIGTTAVIKITVFVKRLVCLRYYILVLFVGSHIAYLVKNPARRLINLTERCFDKAVFIYLCKGCKI